LPIFRIAGITRGKEGRRPVLTSFNCYWNSLCRAEKCRQTYTRPRIQRKRAESPDSALWNYTDIIAVAGFGPVYYTEIISNYTFRFVRRVRGLLRISLSYNILLLFSTDASIYVSFSPS